MHFVMEIGLSGVQFGLLSQNWTAAQGESDWLIRSMITDRIGRYEVLIPINHKNYNFREKKNSQVIKERENLH